MSHKSENMSIRLLGIIDTKPTNTGNPFKQMVSETEKVLGLKKENTMTSRSTLSKLIKEEYDKLIKEVEANNKKISKGLEEMRINLLPETLMRTRKAGATFLPELEKRVELATVAEILDCRVNDLMLYFLNNVKHTNERQLVEYRLGHVYFYAN